MDDFFKDIDWKCQENTFWFQIKHDAIKMYTMIIGNERSNPQKDRKQIQFEFYYRNDKNCNASIKHQCDTDYLIINKGTIIAIFEYIYAVFASPGMFTEIGNPHTEVINNFVSFYQECDNSNKQIEFPKDKTRLETADIVAMYAIRFIINHELGHLLNGHTFILKDIFNESELQMYSNSTKPASEKYSLDIRTLEFDADRFASSRGISSVMSSYMDPDYIAFAPQLLKEKYKLFELYFFATHSIFLFFEYLYGFEFTSESRYLPYHIRQIANYGTSIDFLDIFYRYGFLNREENDIDEIKDMMRLGVFKAETYFNYLYKANYHWEEKERLDKENLDYHWQMIMSNWENRIEPKLRSYSRTILASENTIRIADDNYKQSTKTYGTPTMLY